MADSIECCSVVYSIFRINEQNSDQCRTRPPINDAVFSVGVPFFDEVFAELGCAVEWLRQEGEYLEPVSRVAVVKGEVRKILLGERLALNCISRASGVASVSRRFKEKASCGGWHGKVAGKKTIAKSDVTQSYLYILESYSVLCKYCDLNTANVPFIRWS